MDTTEGVRTRKGMTLSERKAQLWHSTILNVMR